MSKRRDEYAGRFLYHGTRYPNAVVDSDTLKVAPYGDKHVSLTRDFNVALYWASLERDDDEGMGGVVIIERDILNGFSHLEPFVSGEGCEDEHEEACKSDIPLSLVGYQMVWL